VEKIIGGAKKFLSGEFQKDPSNIFTPEKPSRERAKG
jgi:hypothetical protein